MCQIVHSFFERNLFYNICFFFSKFEFCFCSEEDSGGSAPISVAGQNSRTQSHLLPSQQSLDPHYRDPASLLNKRSYDNEGYLASDQLQRKQLSKGDGTGGIEPDVDLSIGPDSVKFVNEQRWFYFSQVTVLVVASAGGGSQFTLCWVFGEYKFLM